MNYNELLNYVVPVILTGGIFFGGGYLMGMFRTEKRFRKMDSREFNEWQREQELTDKVLFSD